MMKRKMDIGIDHYAVLGLPSGEEGAKLAEKEISKAYRLKALKLHPDKRPDDPIAHVNFQKLKTSYEILKDVKARKLFDDLLRVKRDKLKCQLQQESKRRKLMSDLERRERAAFSISTREEEERSNARKFREECANYRSMFANKASATKGNTDATTSARNSTAWKNVSPDDHQAREKLVLEKLKKAAQKQK